MNTAPSFASAKEAAEVVRAGLGFLAAADATAMAAQTQAQCLQILEQATAMGTAARASILAAFTSGQGYCADADYSPKAWLINRTGITKGAAVAYTAWARRAAGHPQVAAALAAGELSESFARMICAWTDRLPGDCREAADTILVTAARAGMDVRDLAGLAAEIYARSLPAGPGEDGDRGFEDRSVTVEATFGGAGVLSGDLTPECAAVVTAVLDALAAPAGAEDTRSRAQRYHDALHEAMQRLVTAGLLPERAGQPVKVWAHISLADLMALDGSSALLQEWTAGVRARWAGHRAEASAGGGDGGAWLDGDAAAAMACDAAMAPIVTGEVNPGALEDLVRLCVELERLRHHPRGGQDDTGTGGDGGQDAAASDTTRAWDALERAIIAGPGSLGDELVVHGAVAHQAVSRRHQDGLQDAVPAGQGPGGDARLLAVEQCGAGPDGRAGGLAAQGGGGRLDGRVVPQPLGLPRLVVGAEVSPFAVEGQAHRRRDRRSVSLVGRQQNRLRVPDRGQASVHRRSFRR